jgi:signal transduction histidine kinase
VNGFTEAAPDQAERSAAQAALCRDHASQVCHDLRGPLAVLYPALSALRVPGLSDEQGQLLDAAQRSVARLTQMVDSLGGSGWLEVDKPPAVPLRVDLRLALASLLDRRAASGSTGFTVELPPGLPPLLVDETHLRIVLGALLSNAARFTADGGAVAVSAEAGASEVLVAVRDTGAGIAASEIEAVCGFGYRGANNPPGWAGLGLGLYAARTLVEDWGGSLTVQSAGGRGTTVVFGVPAAA